MIQVSWFYICPCRLSTVPANNDFWCDLQSLWREGAGGEGEKNQALLVNQ